MTNYAVEFIDCYTFFLTNKLLRVHVSEVENCLVLHLLHSSQHFGSEWCTRKWCTHPTTAQLLPLFVTRAGVHGWGRSRQEEDHESACQQASLGSLHKLFCLPSDMTANDQYYQTSQTASVCYQTTKTSVMLVTRLNNPVARQTTTVWYKTK